MEKKYFVLVGLLVLSLGAYGVGGMVDWNNLNNFPSPCTSGEAVTGINTTPNCQSFLQPDNDNFVSGSFVMNNMDHSNQSFYVGDDLDHSGIQVDLSGTPIVYLAKILPFVNGTQDFGSSSNKWNNIYGTTMHASTYLGQVMESHAVAGASCTASCDKWDGYPNGSQWSCIRALNSSGTSYSCGDTTVRKDCLCQS